MSASNGGLPSDRIITAFSISRAQFPYREDEKINTEEFLEASKAVVSIIDRFGKVFAPVKYDMNGNITKITKKYNENTLRYQFLEDMLLHEKAEGGIVAIDALQWLRRGLHFIVRFFECIIEDEQASVEDLGPFLKVAYSETLECYHGWVGSQMFKVISRFTPSRRDLMYSLALEKHHKDEHVIRDMQNFTVQLSGCVVKLVNFYNEHNLESKAKAK